MTATDPRTLPADPITLTPRRMLSYAHVTPEMFPPPVDPLPIVPAELIRGDAVDAVYAGRFAMSPAFELLTGRLRSFLPPTPVVIDDEERRVLEGDPNATPPGGVIVYDEQSDLTHDQWDAIMNRLRPNSAVQPEEPSDAQ